MIDAYTWPTPNGHKVHIMLEETGLPYPVERYTNEANRLTRVLDEKLGEARYVAGDGYTHVRQGAVQETLKSVTGDW